MNKVPDPIEQAIQDSVYATLSLRQFKEIAEFTKKHHSVHSPMKENQIIKSFSGRRSFYPIKYIESSLDCVDTRIWYVTFKGVGINIRFCMQNLDDLPDGCTYFNLYDWIMAFLKGEWIPSEKLLRGKRGVDNIL